MIAAAMFSFIALLWLLLYISIRALLVIVVGRNLKRARLEYMKRAPLAERLLGSRVLANQLTKHVSDLLESSGSRLKRDQFFLISAALLLTGVLIGSFFFQTVKGVAISSALLGSFPYLTLRMKLLNRQMKSRIEFLPAVEVFYQYYVLSEHKNSRTVLHDALRENRIRYPLKPVFEHLGRNLSTSRDMDESLAIFAITIGHGWGGYFSNILSMSLLEGIDVTENLKELILDMRKAQRTDHAEKNRMLEIRIANFSPLFFLTIFMAVNFYINYENAFFYYFVDPGGKNLLLDASLLIFASFVMGIYLSVKRV
jgi:hypothetical protein